MPRLKPSTQAARREHILDAAELSFARAGFHRATMQDIAREANVSLGALYVYFASKEALIAGIAERDRAKLHAQLADLADAPDLVAALGRLGEHYTEQEPHYKRVLCIEIGAEATRNPAVGEIFRKFDRDVMDSFARLFERARQSGRIAPSVDPKTLALIVGVIGDGLFWRRAVDPTFDSRAVMPAILGMLGSLLNPSDPAAAYVENNGAMSVDQKHEMTS
jgi:TetR/AcrR family transcriptional repressor of uid operon